MMLMDGLPMTHDSSTETISIPISCATPADADGGAAKKKYHREPSEWELPAVPVTKAYRNQDFLSSSHARHLRILAEYEETMQRLRANGVRATIQFFGSARAKDRPQYDAAMAKAQASLSAVAPGSDAYVDATERIAKLKQSEWMCSYMADIQELARLITQWSISTRRSAQVLSGVDRTKSALRASRERDLNSLADALEATLGTSPPGGGVTLGSSPPGNGAISNGCGMAINGSGTVANGNASAKPNGNTSPTARRFNYLPHYTDDNHPDSQSANFADLFVCTGGGPGFMEAANRGASMVPGGRSIGMGISLPFETGLNPYVTPELAFEYHYFFTRKFGMAYYMQALVAAPGGFGTMDELFELMTLKQTGKMNRDMPIVLFGKRYWQTTVNWQALADFGTISQKEVDDLLFTDSIDEAFHFITTRLEAQQRAQLAMQLS